MAVLDNTGRIKLLQQRPCDFQGLNYLPFIPLWKKFAGPDLNKITDRINF
jgi:hypothetical protein